MNVWIQNPFDNLPCEGYRKQRFWLMAEAFVRAGHHVVYWTSDFSHANKAKRAVEKTGGGGDCGFHLVMIPTMPYRKNVSWARVLSHRAFAKSWERAAWTFVKQTNCSPDLIIVSTPTLSGAAAALRLGCRFGAKTIVDVMDAWPETFARLAPCGFQWLARVLLYPLTRQARRLYRDADLVTGVCERYRVLTGRADYYLAYHGVECEERKTENGTWKTGDEDETVEPGRIRLVYAGNIGKTYDLETVFRAVAENPDFALDVAGRWEGPVPERVTVHGYLGQDELADLLASCDVGVVPMNADSWVGVPYKFCDYARAGLRIVSSLGGESAALMARYGCGVSYCPSDVHSLTEAIRAAVRLDRAQARKMCSEVLDAGRIYPAYVRRAEELLTA